ncbi:MAG: redoxin domain-containing protein [Candidatus Eisenbacteria bacterium]|nr:redoxin domain-containing protein [Candidatus Eisenbacteria bacterium]
MTGPAPGEIVPGFELKAIDNQILRFDEKRAGEPILFFFFTREVSNCRAAFPAMERLARRLKDHPGRVWALTRDGHGDSLETADQFQLSFPILLDRSGRVSEAYGADPLPAFRYVGPDLKLREAVDGWDRDRVRAMGRELVASLGLGSGQLFTEDDWLPGR